MSAASPSSSRRLLNDAPKRELWLSYLAIAAVNFVLAFPVDHMGTQTYYGNQPLVVFGMPLWWLMVNPLLPVTAATLAYVLFRQLQGAKGALAVAVPLVSAGIASGGCAWTVWLALNSGASVAGTNLAALATLALACFVLWFLSRLSRPLDETEATGPVDVRRGNAAVD